MHKTCLCNRGWVLSSGNCRPPTPGKFFPIWWLTLGPTTLLTPSGLQLGHFTPQSPLCTSTLAFFQGRCILTSSKTRNDHRAHCGSPRVPGSLLSYPSHCAPTILSWGFLSPTFLHLGWSSGKRLRVLPFYASVHVVLELRVWVVSWKVFSGRLASDHSSIWTDLQTTGTRCHN